MNLTPKQLAQMADYGSWPISHHIATLLKHVDNRMEIVYNLMEEEGYPIHIETPSSITFKKEAD